MISIKNKNLKKKEKIKSNVLILDNIRSAENVGSLFRTGDAVGISQIFLTGITPCPLDRFDRPNKKIGKASLGAENNIVWKYFATTEKAISFLKKEDYFIVAIEQSSNSIDYKKIKVKNKTAFILGNEVFGIPKKILSSADIVAEIPMYGEKESLNVSVSGGIALFKMLNR